MFTWTFLQVIAGPLIFNKYKVHPLLDHHRDVVRALAYLDDSYNYTKGSTSSWQGTYLAEITGPLGYRGWANNALL